jgi:hypothetical protein
VEALWKQEGAKCFVLPHMSSWDQRSSMKTLHSFEGGVVSRSWWKLEGGVISGLPETHPTGGGNRQGGEGIPAIGPKECPNR